MKLVPFNVYGRADTVWINPDHVRKLNRYHGTVEDITTIVLSGGASEQVNGPPEDVAHALMKWEPAG